MSETLENIELSTRVISSGEDSAISPGMEMIEMARRETAGSVIALLWGKVNDIDHFVIAVDAVTTSQHFEISVGGDLETRGRRALDFFEHPFPRIAEVKNLSDKDIFTEHFPSESQAA